MKMEKRALIAFVASILLFLAYDAFYLSPRVEKQRTERAAELERQKLFAGDTLSGSAAIADKKNQSQDPGTQTQAGGGTQTRAGSGAGDTHETNLPTISVSEAAEFVVVTPLYEITLSSAGAEVISFDDIDGRGQQGESVQHRPALLVRGVLVESHQDAVSDHRSIIAARRRCRHRR